MPRRKHTTERTAEQITTLWKVWQRRIEVSAGKISRLEIRSAPIMRMPRTVVMAVKNASSML